MWRRLEKPDVDKFIGRALTPGLNRDPIRRDQQGLPSKQIRRIE
jgi:hypothetical protein